MSSVDAWLPVGGLVLDVGCAMGRNTLALRRSGFRAVGLELDAALVARLRADPATADIAATRADARLLPVRDDGADGAVLVEVLEHIADPDAALAELHRVIRPGGRLCVAVPTAYTEAVYHRLHPRYTANAGHVNRFSRRDLQSRLQRAGFVVERCEPENLGPALSWLVHAVLRSDADHTGVLQSHRWVDYAVGGGLRVLGAMPLARQALQRLRHHVGKSRYFYCVAT